MNTPEGQPPTIKPSATRSFGHPLGTVDEIAKALKVSPGLIYKGAKLGKIPHIRVCGSVRVPWSYVDEKLASVEAAK